MNRFLILLYTFCISFSSVSEVHEFHLSKSIINYSTEEKSIQITMNMFIDDLELALKSEGADSLKLCTRSEKASAEDYIYKYILDSYITEQTYII